MSGSKYDSGAEKRKQKINFMKSQQGSTLKHFKRSTADEDLEERVGDRKCTDDEFRRSNGVICQ